MPSTLNPACAEPSHDGDPAAAAAKDRFTGVEEALARLAHRAASDAPDPRTLRSETPPAPRVAPPALETTLRPADFRDPMPSDKPPPARRAAGVFARLALAVCIGAIAMMAWRSYGGAAGEAAKAMVATWMTSRSPTREIAQNPATPDGETTTEAAAPRPDVAMPAPPAAAPPTASQAAPVAPPATITDAPNEAATPADRQQIETMARDLAALRQTVEQLAVSQDRLKAEIAKLQAVDKPPEKRTPRRVSAPLPPAVAAPARKPATPPALPMSSMGPPPAAPPVSTGGPLVPPPAQAAPPIPSEPQPSIEPPPLRPPMPVPQL
jgi:hypothetical protein